MNKIHFLTIETDIHSGYESKLLHSCNLKGIPMNVYGKGTKWEGFITKFKILKDILPTIDSELICLTDSRDVLYMADSDKIYTTFLTHFNKHSLVFNGETNCYPNPDFASLHPHPERKYKFLNSGCVIGSKAILEDVIDECLRIWDADGVNDDQYILQKIMFTKKYPITLDYDCKIFQCIWDEDWGRSNNFDLMYRKNTIYNRLTDTYPLIYHAPGPTTTLSQVWKILNGRYYKPNKNNFW